MIQVIKDGEYCEFEYAIFKDHTKTENAYSITIKKYDMDDYNKDGFSLMVKAESYCIGYIDGVMKEEN